MTQPSGVLTVADRPRGSVRQPIALQVVRGQDRQLPEKHWSLT
jgi:hypothetical protein